MKKESPSDVIAINEIKWYFLDKERGGKPPRFYSGANKHVGRWSVAWTAGESSSTPSSRWWFWLAEPLVRHSYAFIAYIAHLTSGGNIVHPFRGSPPPRFSHPSVSSYRSRQFQLVEERSFELASLRGVESLLCESKGNLKCHSLLQLFIIK